MRPAYGMLLFSVHILLRSVHPLKLSPPLQHEQKLFEYQEQGIARLLTGRRMILADEMGLGKTVQCICALNRLALENRSTNNTGTNLDANGIVEDLDTGTGLKVLVVCPKSVLSVWREELRKWLDPCAEISDVTVITGKECPSVVGRGMIVLVNYDICHKHRDILRSHGKFDVLICDEAHYLKNPASQRTRAVLGDYKLDFGISCNYLWLLTGTPIMNRPIDLFPLLRAIDDSEWGDLNNFRARYCNPKRGRWGGMEYGGATNLKELSHRIAPVTIRRCKADVLSQLPAKVRSCVNLAGAELQHQRERDAAMNLIGEGASMFPVRASNTRGDEFDVKSDHDFADGEELSLADFCGCDALSLSSILGIDASGLRLETLLGMLSAVRRETAMEKLRPALELLRDATSSHKVVVFAHHRRLILDLVAAFGKNSAVCVLGGTSAKARAAAVRRFQTDDDVRLFVGSIRAAGVGLTLTAASHVVFLELDWSPSIMSQAEDRCHRVGQMDCVLVQYYVFSGTIDEWIARALLAKQGDIGRVLELPNSSSPPAISSSFADDAYRLNFGKHRGCRVDDLPLDYLNFIVTKDGGAIWRSRPALWSSLFLRGIIKDQPPPMSVESKESSAEDVDYVFDFGKHSGKRWGATPLGYRNWVMEREVWRNKPRLREALAAAGRIGVQELNQMESRRRRRDPGY